MISVDIEKRLKTYNGQQVIRISQKFAPGSITNIYGPSGSGKTTFLKCLAGLTAPDAGSIVVDEQLWYDSLTKVDLSPQKRKVGFVFQDYALFPNMTVQQHLAYATKDTEWINRLLNLGKLE